MAKSYLVSQEFVGVPDGVAELDPVGRVPASQLPDGPAGASPSARGLVRLSGDLGGTADDPTVPGLIDKVDTDDPRLSDARDPLTHTHTIGQIVGLSGTPDSTTFLRGDGVWAQPPTSTSGVMVIGTNVDASNLPDGTDISDFPNGY